MTMKLTEGSRSPGEEIARTDPVLRVDISVFGRFQAYQLAKQLERRGVLETLFTSYPYAIDGVQKKHINNPWHLKTLEVLATRYLPTAGQRRIVSDLFVRKFDRHVASRIEETSRDGMTRVLHGWASQCLQTLKTAKQAGFKTFVECSCPHPIYKTKLLTEEAGLMGMESGCTAKWIDTVTAECEVADYISVPSNYSYDSFVQLGYQPEKLVKLPLGVDLEEMEKAYRGSSGPAHSKNFKVLMVGTDPLRKGGYYLLKAWERLRLKDAELIIRCDLPDRAKPLLKQSGVTYIPPIHRQKLTELYQEATIFCFPSVDDGFGMVVLEAMAAGLPVIITQHVGASDVVREGMDGFVVPIRDVDALCEKITLLYENREMAEEMGRNARKRAEEYTWERHGESMIKAYRELSSKP